MAAAKNIEYKLNIIYSTINHVVSATCVDSETQDDSTIHAHFLCSRLVVFVLCARRHYGYISQIKRGLWRSASVSPM